MTIKENIMGMVLNKLKTDWKSIIQKVKDFYDTISSAFIQENIDPEAVIVGSSGPSSTGNMQDILSKNCNAPVVENPAPNINIKPIEQSPNIIRDNTNTKNNNYRDNRNDYDREL